jgi:putative ABC transport system permease protein
MLQLATFKQFLSDMRRQKLRTLLTMFGIFWGTCSIVLLFAFGKGIGDAQIKSQKGMGENIAIFWPGLTSKPYKGLPRGRRIRFTEQDIRLIKSTARTIDRISPEYSKWRVPMKVGQQNTIRNVVGIWPEFGEMRNLIPDVGSRFISELDIRDKRRVVFIGNRLKKDLFGDKEAVGETLLLNGVPFTVVGVMKDKKQDSSYNGRDSRKAFIPSTTFQAMYSHRYPNNFVTQCKPEYTMKMSRAEIDQVLGTKYKYHPDDEEALSVWDTTEGMAFIKNFFFAFRMFLVGIGIATLITGGIGVSNIMNVVLEERTKEIGIKMALGARQTYILMQFIVETLLITSIGGLAGFTFAYLIVSVFPMLNLEDYIGVPVVDIWAGIIAAVLLGIVGLTAGYFPARRAANLQPVQALKLF